MASDKQRLHELLFREREGRELADWIAEERAKETSWQQLARELYRRSDGELTASNVTLASWYDDKAAA